MFVCACALYMCVCVCVLVCVYVCVSVCVCAVRMYVYRVLSIRSSTIVCFMHIDNICIPQLVIYFTKLKVCFTTFLYSRIVLLHHKNESLLFKSHFIYHFLFFSFAFTSIFFLNQRHNIYYIIQYVDCRVFGVYEMLSHPTFTL
jgi:hypothetical protein